MVRGLKAKTEYNGMIGTVVSPEKLSCGRWEVCLEMDASRVKDNRKGVKIRECNLRRGVVTETVVEREMSSCVEIKEAGGTGKKAKGLFAKEDIRAGTTLVKPKEPKEGNCYAPIFCAKVRAVQMQQIADDGGVDGVGADAASVGNGNAVVV